MDLFLIIDLNQLFKKNCILNFDQEILIHNNYYILGVEETSNPK